MDYIKLPQDNIPLVLLGDVMQGLKKIPSESISCIVTSPPYWNLRDYYMPFKRIVTNSEERRSIFFEYW